MPTSAAVESKTPISEAQRALSANKTANPNPATTRTALSTVSTLASVDLPCGPGWSGRSVMD